MDLHALLLPIVASLAVAGATLQWHRRPGDDTRRCSLALLSTALGTAVLVAMLRLSGNFHTEGFKGTVMDLVFDVLAAVVGVSIGILLLRLVSRLLRVTWPLVLAGLGLLALALAIERLVTFAHFWASPHGEGWQSATYGPAVAWSITGVALIVLGATAATMVNRRSASARQLPLDTQVT